ATGAANEFVIDNDPLTGATATATAFRDALNATLEKTAESELAAASTYAASQNFFNGAGEPVLRVSGSDPYTSTALRVATATDTVMWYRGETPSVAAVGMGRLTASSADEVVTLRENIPVSSAHGFRITGATANVTNAGSMVVAHTPGNPLSVSFDDTNPLVAG